jgi:thymidylate kinase
MRSSSIQNMTDLFSTFFGALNESGIPYGITGRTELFPHTIHSDVDIVIPSDQFKAFWAFMRDLQEKQVDWIQVISHESAAHFCIVSLSDKPNHRLLKPDVCADYYREGTLFLKADYLLTDRVFNPKGFFQLAPDREFIYYVLKKIDKGTIEPEHFKHLRDQWNRDPEGCLKATSSFFTKEGLTIIGDAFENNDDALLIHHIPSLQKNLHQHLRFRIHDRVLRLVNRVSRVVNPTGLVVAFMGPDGCGKTTIIDGVNAHLTEVFRHNKQFHLFPRERKAAAPTTAPHAEKKRGAMSSVLKLFYYLGLYVVGYWGKVYPLRVRSTLVIFDRYFHDLMVDPDRYRYGAGNAWLKLVGAFIPKPDLWILLDAPSDVIQGRKAEVPEEETARQVSAYRTLFSRLKNAHVVNANQPPELVTFDVESIIVQHLKQRTANRYKNA